MREIGERWAEARSLSVGAVGVLENCAMRNEGGNGGTPCRERRSRPGHDPCTASPHVPFQAENV